MTIVDRNEYAGEKLEFSPCTCQTVNRSSGDEQWRPVPAISSQIRSGYQSAGSVSIASRFHDYIKSISVW